MNRKQIKSDLEKTIQFIGHINKNQHENYLVVVEDYLSPSYGYEILPMNHTEGLASYFRSLRNVLQKTLDRGHIDIKELPIGAPDYLKELVSSG